MLTRRQAMIGAGATCLLASRSVADQPRSPSLEPKSRFLADEEKSGIPGRARDDGNEALLTRLEHTLAGGRLGVAAIDLASGRRLAHGTDIRFPFCSTFKLPLAAAVFAQAAAGRLQLDRVVRVSRADLVPHAPVVEAHVAAGTVTVRELCRAVMLFSDNAAANLLLGLIGGPAGLTRFLRAQGDGVSRLDHLEPGLNVTRGDPADTTTPAAMLALTRRLLLGPVLSPAARAQLIEWMTQNDTGLPRLRAGLPRGWRAGSRTGTADGETNDVLIAWPPEARAPVLAACYVDAPVASDAARLAVQAAVGRRVAALAG